MLAASVVLGLVLTTAAAPAFCTGQPMTSESGVPVYPNGQRVVDGFGKEYYPNGARVTTDYGDEIRYSNGARVRNSTGDPLYPNGSPVKSTSRLVRYANGQQTRPSTGACYFETSAEMSPCQRVVSVRERLAGGEVVFYQLDIIVGAIDLRQVRYEFPSGSTVITLAVDLASGRLDRASIGAVCGSGTSSR